VVIFICRSYSCFILLSAIFPIPFWCRWYLFFPCFSTYGVVLRFTFVQDVKNCCVFILCSFLASCVHGAASRRTQQQTCEFVQCETNWDRNSQYPWTWRDHSKGYSQRRGVWKEFLRSLYWSGDILNIHWLTTLRFVSMRSSVGTASYAQVDLL
jgi:hypothetical protein